MNCPKCKLEPEPKNVIGDENTPYICAHCHTSWTVWQQDRIAALESQALKDRERIKELRETLKQLEWSDNAGNLGQFCPICHGKKPGSGLTEEPDVEGHETEPGCRLARLLKEEEASPDVPQEEPGGWDNTQMPCKRCNQSGNVVYRMERNLPGSHSRESCHYHCSACGADWWTGRK